jgi:hypothetical protein
MTLFSDEDNAVEVNGIRFETVISDRIIVIPSRQPEIAIPVACGIQLTNTTEPQSLLLLSIRPEFRDTANCIMSWKISGADGRRRPQLSDLKILNSGESILFIHECRFLRQNHLMSVAFIPRNGKISVLRNLQVGSYTLQFIFSSNLQQQLWFQQHLPTEDRSLLSEIPDLWTGEVVTAPVQIQVVSDTT